MLDKYRRWPIFNFFLFIFITACASSPAYRHSPSWAIPPPIPKAPKQKSISPKDLLITPKLNATVVIDAGHGGKDLGTYSRKPPKYQEKYLTLATARMVKNYLEKMGCTVIMTRTEDVFIALEERSRLANESSPNLFVSIHYNSAANRQAEGIEIFYFRSETDKQRSSSSKALAHAILKSTLKTTDAKSRGVKQGNLSVLRGTQMPAVLIEGGFLTNEKELQNLKNGVYLKKISWGIAQGIQDFLLQRN